MRRVYIVGTKECEDETALDALLAQGGDPEEIDNPVCPVCGYDTLLAYEEDDDYDVLTWFCLVDPHEYDHVDKWYLVCQHPGCTWEEEVERVLVPDAETTFFDMNIAHMILDEKMGLISRHPTDMKRLIRALERIEAKRPSRKLTAFLEEARYRYEDDMKQIREWLKKVPEGRRVSFTSDERKEEDATFVTATDEGFLVITAAEELLSINAESLHFYGPKSFPPLTEPEPPPKKSRVWNSDDWFYFHCDVEFVEIRGFVLQVCHTDQFGRYHVRCWEEAAARELQLTQISEGYWEGVFRKSAIEAQFEKQRMVKVKGIWLEVVGYRDDGARWVRTRDAEEGALLGFKPQRQVYIGQEETGQEPIFAWDGKATAEEIEDEKDVRRYSWPIPEAKSSG